MKRLTGRTVSTIALTALAAALLLAAPPSVLAIEGFRGATWGELRWDEPKQGTDNLILNGWIKQGIDWERWGNTSLNTYATIRYKWDTEQLDWNNSIGPGVGISLDTYSPKGIFFTIGVEYLWENRYIDSARMDQKISVYCGWYGWWDLK